MLCERATHVLRDGIGTSVQFALVDVNKLGLLNEEQFPAGPANSIVRRPETDQTSA